MSYARKLILYVLLLLVALALCGCMQADYHIKLNKDQSVDVQVVIALDESIVASEALEGATMLQGVYDSLKEQGFELRDYMEGSLVGVQGTKHLASYADLAATDGNSITITDASNLFYHKYRIQGEFNLSSMDDDSYPDLDGGSLTDLFYDSFDMKFRLTLPGTPTNHNATSATDHTLVWDLAMGKNNIITAEVVVLRPWAITAATLLGLALLGGIMALIKKKRPPVQEAP